MKKWMKRIVSIALVAVMTLALATAAMAADDESTHDAHFIFTDIDEPQPDLYVAKTATSALEGYTYPEDTEFTFVLKWDQDGDGNLEFAENEIYYVYNEDGTTVLNPSTGTDIFRTSETGRFTLKAGQYARFEWAGEVEYEITELGVEDFIQTEPAGGEAATGTVDEKGTYITFENLYIPSPDPEVEGETTQLSIRKDIAWPDGYEMPDLSDIEFTFQVSIDGSPYANEAYTVYDASMTTQEGAGRTDSQGRLTITGGQLALFEEVPAGVDYKVEEVDLDTGWRAVGTTSYEGATTTPIVYTYFTNAPTAFSVEKIRTDGVIGTDGGTFTFRLTDENGDPMSGITYYLYDANGRLVTMDSDTDEEGGASAAYKTGEDGTFTLEAGQKVLFIGLAEGTEYKIVEETDESEEGRSFTVSPADGVAGAVDTSSVEEYEFENEELTDITITKYSSRLNTDRNLLGGAEFTIYKLAEGGDADNEEDWDPYPNETDAVKTTSSDDGTLTFTNLPAGTYKIVETKTPAGYAMAEAIVVTLPYSLENPTNGAVYSERDGVYYLYTLNYDVDNHAVLQMPNTGGKAWIIIVIAICGAAAALTSVYVYRRRHSGKEKVRA